eukprot:TRINITY_DN4113_c0_g3_i1.p1 TRINITY_DN4113_c0_g3~~TRINITY_DN4113_c0_g3_i1.p1  ORF type:complete len:362 (+),score=64.82 TRINITY_DN4113_c0_g3_i1:134-1087(+)
MAEATSNFSRDNSLGRSNCGTAYMGEIDSAPVTIMKLTPDNSQQAGERFLKEIDVLSTARHPRLVKLLGFCVENRCIVYEMLPGGNLEEVLSTKAGRGSLGQKDRLRIAAEVAEGLDFLHALPNPIMHQDVKPASIMLEENKACKLGNMGLAKFLPVNDSSAWGTAGYIDPLLLRTGRYGPQSDIYGLGLVILQLLTGEKVNKVLEYVKFGLDGVLEHLDSTVTWDPKLARDAAELALQCRDRGERPDLKTHVLPVLQDLYKSAPVDSGLKPLPTFAGVEDDNEEDESGGSKKGGGGGSGGEKKGGRIFGFLFRGKK